MDDWEDDIWVVWHDDSSSDWALRKAVELKGQDRSLSCPRPHLISAFFLPRTGQKVRGIFLVMLIQLM